MEVRLRLWSLITLLISQGVSATNPWETLNRYATNEEVDVLQVAEAYNQALSEVKKEIIELENRLKESSNCGSQAEIEEGECDSGRIWSTISLYKDSLYNLSSDGILGEKIKGDSRIKGIEIKSFDDLEMGI